MWIEYQTQYTHLQLSILTYYLSVVARCSRAMLLTKVNNFPTKQKRWQTECEQKSECRNRIKPIYYHYGSLWCVCPHSIRRKYDLYVHWEMDKPVEIDFYYSVIDCINNTVKEKWFWFIFSYLIWFIGEAVRIQHEMKRCVF